MNPIYTLGHSTLPIEVFLAALADHRIERLADIRSIPQSRRNPQFAQHTLQAATAQKGIEYFWMRELGGRRRPRPDSINTGWRNESFRGYADYMQTDQFRTALDALLQRADRPTAILCAEAVPWRCHRSLVADALVVRGVIVSDIFVQPGGGSAVKSHALPGFARVEEGRLWYPPEDATELSFVQPAVAR
jgi:uncharacterized protein (DUF488 family)